MSDTDTEYNDYVYDDIEFEEVERYKDYGRTPERLGSGAYKEVFKGIDHERGIEVAWNRLRLPRDVSQRSDYLKEIQFLQTLRHPNIIRFYSSWIDEKEGTVVFITEWMSSGTLKQFIRERFHTNQSNLKPIQNWCRQILSGLEYLHTRDPPIIHRDIKCDNIFIDATSGRVKVGDLGLAREFLSDTALTVIGTPEFMAPEFYNEHYTERVDVWAFGMSVIEMVSGYTPYHQLNPVQIYRKVIEGELPQEIEYITHPDLLAFIKLCLLPEETRPSCTDLLNHPFLELSEDFMPIMIDESLDALLQPVAAKVPIIVSPPKVKSETAPEPVLVIEPSPQRADETPPHREFLNLDACNYSAVSSEVIHIDLCIECEDCEQQIDFDLNVKEDTAYSIAAELVSAMSLPGESISEISDLIQQYIDGSGLLRASTN